MSDSFEEQLNRVRILAECRDIINGEREAIFAALSFIERWKPVADAAGRCRDLEGAEGVDLADHQACMAIDAAAGTLDVAIERALDLEKRKDTDATDAD